MSACREPATPRQFIDHARSLFERAAIHFGHGTDNAGDEAAWLILGALELDFDCDEEALDRCLEPHTCEKLRHVITRRIDERMPVAYLLGQGWFCGLPFSVDQRVLIPRSPIAELIEEQFLPWVDTEKVRHILDIGTGCGCIAIATALAFPDARVDAVDISEEALELAAENSQRHGTSSRIHLHHSDLYAELPKKKYDIIVANPPYVDAEDMSQLPAEYRHEPRSALAAGADGLDLVRRIIEQSTDYLAQSGILVVEVGNSQPALEAVYPDLPFLWLDFARGGQGVFLLTRQQLDVLA